MRQTLSAPSMRLLYIHADYMEYETRKPTAIAEEVNDIDKRRRLEEVLVSFIAVENQDEGKIEEIANQAANDISETAARVGAQRILLYPYAHLSSELSDPETGVSTLRRLQEILRERGLETYRAPFGWYKSFKISCKGHPLSELSRHIVAGEEKTAPKGEERFIVLTPDGVEWRGRGRD